ncbi:hypothetical protein [Maribellus maritimus]|uniref:hypothetical protein n=1 Tax=Maribellus maritimus TaxID=2870838 RepID=UPI001EEA6179|nr:hypothetical protein [Maribellus maritimus]MCG6190835.1 hypothetical protein [Maribellus maritimus]
MGIKKSRREFVKNSSLALPFLASNIFPFDGFTEPDETINIGCYTQLFVDDYLVQSMHNLKRKMHVANKHNENPLIVPEQALERKYKYHYTWDNGSVIWDKFSQLYKMYHSQVQRYTLYAESKDGIVWEKPDISKVSYNGTKHNNILFEGVSPTTVIFNEKENDGFYYRLFAGKQIFKSHDGLEWIKINTNQEFPNDSGAVVYDPFKDLYISVSKDRYPIGKIIQNPLTAEEWDIPIRVLGLTRSKDSVFWSKWKEILRPDEEDHRSVEEKYPAVFVEGFLIPWRMKPEFVAAHAFAEKSGFLDRLTVPPQKNFHHLEFMNMILIPYHNLYIGLLEVLNSTAQVIDFGAKGSPRAESPGQDGTMEVQLVCSRDLKNWMRLGGREPFIPLGGIKEWDRSMIMPFTSNNIIVDGKMRIYYGGSIHSHRPNSMWNKPGNYPEERQALGMATIRKDGFVSIDATSEEGILLTKPIVFDGANLILNADASKGFIEVCVTDEEGEIIPGYERHKCQNLSGDELEYIITWENKKNLAGLQNQKVRLKFFLKNASLYSFTIN